MELQVFVAEGETNVTLCLTRSHFKVSDDFKFYSPVVDDYGTIVTSCGVTTTPETSSSSAHEVCVTAHVIPSTLTIRDWDSGKVFTFLTATRTSLDVRSVSILYFIP